MNQPFTYCFPDSLVCPGFRGTCAGQCAFRGKGTSLAWMLPLPPSRLRFMGEDDETFLRIADSHARELRERAGLASATAILDIGCGYGRLLYGLRRSGWDGRYLGIDVLQRHVDWCTDALADERTDFRWLDVHNHRYNPGGDRGTDEVQVGGEWDVVVFASVFTHMWPDDVVSYLRLARRLVASDGRVFSTWLFSDRRSDVSKWSLQHRHRWYCRFESEDDPLHAVGYDERWVRWRASSIGLRPETVAYGWWADGAEGPPGQGQDRVVFRPR